MKKTIIALSGTANVGKSMTIARLGRQLQANGGNTTDVIAGNDYRAIFNYKKRIIGIQTYGDYEGVVREGLDHFLNHNCDIIVVVSKSYGATTRRITGCASQNGYRLIWSTPYLVWDGTITEDVVKNYCASHLLLMIDDTITGAL